MSNDKGMVRQSWSWDTALRGVIPPMISPLANSGDPDEAAAGRLVEQVLAGGAAACSCWAAVAKARG
ncbi:MAG: hypothetical protein ACHQ7N_08070 [Candidatus Methylomirabilales bacterium]